MTRVSVLITCHNRREKTVECLARLYRQRSGRTVRLQVFLVDDGSTDGTAAAVQERFPGVQVVQGSGSLFWAGGMRSAWGAAQSIPADFVLLLNDDSMLDQWALDELLACQRLSRGIAVGCMRSPSSGRLTYGGFARTASWRPVHRLLAPHPTVPLRCGHANANALLVPVTVIEQIGFLAPEYTHLLADFDFTLRAARAGVPVVITRMTVGECEDDHGQPWLGAERPLADRIAYLRNPKYLAYSEYLHFVRTHFPLYVPIAWIKLWGKTLFPSLWELRYRWQP